MFLTSLGPVILVLSCLRSTECFGCYNCDPFEDHDGVVRYCDWKTNEEKDEITCSTPSLPEDYVNPKTTLEWLTYTKARKLIAPNDMEFICYTMKAGYENKEVKLFRGCIIHMREFNICRNISKIFTELLKLKVYRCETCNYEHCNKWTKKSYERETTEHITYEMVPRSESFGVIKIFTRVIILLSYLTFYI